MKGSILTCALLLGTAVAVGAQQPDSSNPYVGTSNPPPDSTITTPLPQTQAKPSPVHPMTAHPQVVAPEQSIGLHALTPAPGTETQAADSADGTDDGIVQVAPNTGSDGAAQPELNQRVQANDPDGDIVHPAPLPPGELGEGTMIRARLLNDLSTSLAHNGDTFRAKVASDVYRGNQVLIPSGSEIDGTVLEVSAGHFAGHGSMMLRPQTVILPDGSKFRLYAQVWGAPGSNTNVGGEGRITPGSRLKKDGIIYGGGVGTGAVAGAALGGPAGALAGSVVAAGAVTMHLLLDHPQATLAEGTVLEFALTQPLNLVRESAAAGQ
jgi:hypothetical protein